VVIPVPLEIKVTTITPQTVDTVSPVDSVQTVTTAPTDNPTAIVSKVVADG